MRNILLLIGFTIGWASLFGQVFNRFYDFRNPQFNDSSESEVSGIIYQTKDSGYISVFQSANLYSTGDQKNQSMNYIRITKKGITDFIKNYRKMNLNTYPNSAILDKNENMYVCGYTYSQKHFDIFLSKFNNKGDTIWSKSYKDTLELKTRSVLLASNSLFVTGHDVWGSKIVNGFLMKTDTNGKLVWKKTYLSKTNDYFVNLQKIDNNTFCISGGENNLYDKKLDEDISEKLVMFVDSLGSIKKKFSFKSDTSIFGYILKTVYKNGKLLVVGEETFKDVNHWTKPHRRQYVAMWDTSGKLLWRLNPKRLPLFSADFCDGYFKEDGKIVVCGNTKDTVSMSQTGNIFLIDSTGNQLWEKIYYGDGGGYFYGMSSTFDGGQVCVGFNRDPKNRRKDQDLWIVRTDSNGCDTTACLVTGVEEPIERGTEEIRLVPNPVTNSFIINSELNIKELIIYNTLGEIVLCIPNYQKDQTVNIESLVKGLYWVKGVGLDNRDVNTKLVKE